VYRVRVPPADQSPTFDDALEEIEQIVARIESGEVGLEKSISEYERGAALIKACRETLQRAEQRVRDLTAQMQADSAAPKPGQPPQPPEPGGGEDTPF
jgi:exodeoxyribonuclease VII small subunit